MHISEFDYELPEELIAQAPLKARDASRMMVVDRAAGSWKETAFASFPDLLRAGDVVVVNNTRVFPARLIGERDPSGGRVELLLLREIDQSVWEALARPAHRLNEGARIRFQDSLLRAKVIGSAAGGVRRIQFTGETDINASIERIGQTPLPPYIKRPDGTSVQDVERYQTVFASEKGAIAAPTAGLHFTPEVLKRISEVGAQTAEITLHVGYGTFEPVRVEQIEEHQVAAEFFSISEPVAKTLNKARAAGGRIIAIGTTTTRALETAIDEKGLITAGTGDTALTIKPGYKFRAVDALLTNFHLPRSSLLILVSAFAGRELILDAYKAAVASRFRFYSYGDCMFVI
ncbi:MAG TPA: tRNA preQ1(34) S-adenosylmethionine ribosyltransferase-isomerase QueA [Pyrinomonadaceae bacterium]|nr:tRNA preQ1(34) S-adenosylmethionine ribosyltransferase-isomerase QueA [Pyrinomonadaceae bacterium]